MYWVYNILNNDKKKKNENSVRCGNLDESLRTSDITEAKKRNNFQKTNKKHVGEANPKKFCWSRLTLRYVNVKNFINTVSGKRCKVIGGKLNLYIVLKMILIH